jgi:competence protein ComEC
MAAFGTGPLIAASAGVILLGLLRTPLRWSGAAVLVIAVVWAVRAPQPDVLISADGRNVGVRGQDGRLHLMRSAKNGSKDGFLVKEWLAADADARSAGDASLTEGVSCDDSGCVAQGAGGAFVAMALRPQALADDCERAALVVTARQAPASCAASVIDAERLRAAGALALREAATAMPSLRSSQKKSTGRGRRRSRGKARRNRPLSRRALSRRAPSMLRRRKPTCRRKSS